MAVYDDGIKAFLEAYTYFSKMLGKGMEKIAKKFAEEATGVKAPEKLEPVIPGNEVIRIPSKVEKGELTTIDSTFSDPLKSDLVLSKIDGTAASKYTALRSETELMFPKFTQDLQYIKDNNIALTTVQKNNILNNLRLKRSLESDIKRLETNLVADKKNPQMIYEAYKQSVGKRPERVVEDLVDEKFGKGYFDDAVPSMEKIDPKASFDDLLKMKKQIDELQTDTQKILGEPYNKANAETIRKNNILNKYDGKGYGPNEAQYRTIARNFLIAEQKAGRIEMPTNIYQRISFGGVDPMIDPIKLFRYHYGDNAFEKIPLQKLEDMFAKKGLKEQDYKYILREAGITPINKTGPNSYAGYSTPKELKAEILDIDQQNDIILAGDSPFFKSKSEIVNAIKNNNDKRVKFVNILKQIDTPKKAGKGKFTKAEVIIARMKNSLEQTSGKTDSDSKYVQETFPNMIKELEAKPELANNENVFKSFSEDMPKNQRLVEYDDGTIDFFQQTEFGPQNIASAQKRAEELNISIKEAAKINQMEPEDQILEIQRIKTLMEKETPFDDTVVDIEDYFGPDDKPKHARGGIVSLL